MLTPDERCRAVRREAAGYLPDPSPSNPPIRSNKGLLFDPQLDLWKTCMDAGFVIGSLAQNYSSALGGTDSFGLVPSSAAGFVLESVSLSAAPFANF